MTNLLILNCCSSFGKVCHIEHKRNRCRRKISHNEFNKLLLSELSFTDTRIRKRAFQRYMHFRRIPLHITSKLTSCCSIAGRIQCSGELALLRTTLARPLRPRGQNLARPALRQPLHPLPSILQLLPRPLSVRHLGRHRVVVASLLGCRRHVRIPSVLRGMLSLLSSVAAIAPPRRSSHRGSSWETMPHGPERDATPLRRRLRRTRRHCRRRRR